MNKNLKIVSSLALAGILATTGLTGASRVSAVGDTIENDVTTRSVAGKYATLGGVENVVPYILNAGDHVTIADIRTEFGSSININGNAALSPNNIVGTGDTFKVGSTTYTVLVYGDIDGDGEITSSDAVETLKHSARLASALDKGSLYKEAANVETSYNELNSSDASRILNYSAKLENVIRANKPANVTPAEEGYTLTVGDNNVINNQNDGTVDGFKIILDVDSSKISSEDNRNLEVKVYDENGKPTTVANTVKGTLNKNSNKAEILNVALDGTETKLAKADLGMTNNGLYTVEVLTTVNGKKVVLARIAVNVAIYTPTAAKVNVTRPSATKGALSLEGYGESKIVAVEYTINSTKNGKFENLNNKLENVQFEYECQAGETKYPGTYTLVDEFGNKSTPQNITIPKHSAKPATAVGSVTAPVLKDVTPANAKFTTDVTVASGEAVLYKKSANGSDVIVDRAPISSANYVTFAFTEAGTYRVGVIVTNAPTATNSAEVLSNYVEVKELNAVSNIVFTVKDNGIHEISWTDTNNKDNLEPTNPSATPTPTSSYDFDFECLDGDNGYKKFNGPSLTIEGTSVAEPTISNLDVENHTVEVNGLVAGKVYRVTINAKNKTTQAEYIDNANPTVSNPFFFINANNLLGNLTSKTNTTLTYELNNPVKVNGVDATYKAEVYVVKTDLDSNTQYADPDKGEMKNATVTTVNGKQYLTIEGLNPNTQYVAKIVANVGNVQGKSNLVGYDSTNKYTNAPMTYKTTPAINDLAILHDNGSNSATTGTIYVKSNGEIVVNGDTKNPIAIDTVNAINTTNNYTPEFNTILDLASKLLDNDKITVNNNSLGLTLTDDASGDNSAALTLTDDYEGLEINVKGNNVDSDRKITIDSGAKLAKLVVNGEGLILDLTNNDTDTPVYLYNGAQVTGNNTYTLVKGATATISGVIAESTSADMSITASGEKNLTVNAPKGNINTNLTFENKNDERYTVRNATINFRSTDPRAAISGTVTIISSTDDNSNGKITVTSPSDNSLDLTQLNLDISVKDANVDIKGFTDSSNVNVSVETTKEKTTPTTVVAKLSQANMDILNEIETLNQEGITDKYVLCDRVMTLKKYEEDEAMMINHASGNVELKGKARELMQEFIDSIGMDNENVTIKFGTTTSAPWKLTDEATITISANTDMSKVDLSGFATKK